MAKQKQQLHSPKHLRFCEEYVADLNGTQAAIRAGYSAAGARSMPSQLLTKLNVQLHVTYSEVSCESPA